ncbi:MAG: bifunctional precorrin-2 dehydrogenase/sirohydrochlorin ferrochelatase [Chloroflexi bacterium]|nr:bifunctional precorrin-2 dehydrogenase/sirohydrochlorin ferrochelatase [Chloroflexota bacterium]
MASSRATNKRWSMQFRVISKMHYYPVLLDLRRRRCVVIGGGRVAEGKIKSLIEAEAEVTVVAPDLTQDLEQLACAGQFVLLRRSYRNGDLAGAFLAISATDDRATNEAIWQEADALNILVNVVDDVPHCNFIAPSIMRRGDLVVAISTSGKAPALAVRLRQQLETRIGDEHARFLELAGQIRAPLAARYPDFEQRKALWYQLVDSDVLNLLRQGQDEAARQRMGEIMGVAPPGQYTHPQNIDQDEVPK